MASEDMHSVMGSTAFTDSETQDPVVDNVVDSDSDASDLDHMETRLHGFFENVGNQLNKYKEQADKRHRNAMDSVNQYVHEELAKIKSEMVDLRNAHSERTDDSGVAEQIKQLQQQIKAARDKAESSSRESKDAISVVNKLAEQLKETKQASVESGTVVQKLAEKLDETKKAAAKSVQSSETAVKKLAEQIESSNPPAPFDLQQLKHDVQSLKKTSDERFENMKQRSKYLKTRIDGGSEESALRESLKLTALAYIKYKKKYMSLMEPINQCPASVLAEA